MAKKKAAVKKKLMPAGKVVVKSRAYGMHERAARGSKTPVVINAVLQKNAGKTAVVVAMAKRVHDLLKICGERFKESGLWPEMLSRMRKAASMEALDLLTALKGTELNSRYKLDRFVHPQVRDVKWDEKGCEMVVSKGYPHWTYDDTEYCYEVFLLILGTEAEKDGLMSVRSEWMGAEDRDGEMRFAFVMPEDVAYYLVCLHFMTGRNGKATGMRANMGMKVVEVGKGNSEVNKKL